MAAPSAVTTTGEDAAGLAPWLVCRAGTRFCAMALGHVIEIMRVLPIEALPGAPPFVSGLSIIRGSPVPVIDVALLFGDSGLDAERLVTVRADGRTVALAFASVAGVHLLDVTAANDLPSLMGDASREAISAIGILDAALLLFLNAARILPESLFDSIGTRGAA